VENPQINEPSPAFRRCKWRRLKWLAVLLLLLCCFFVTCYFCRAPLLRHAANAWIVNETLSQADVIVVLGGGPDTRPFEAARLFHQGIAPRILVMNPRPSSSTQLGLIPTEADLTSNILLKLDVPRSDIFVPAELVTNSFDESIVVRNWAQTNGFKRVIIPTDIFHTRRVRWLYGKELKATGIHAQIEAVPVREYSASNWWQSEQGVIAFQNEVLKYAYYRLKY
jgi:uncharacterized SAM-binding protein YcdF (DUF218 family)